MTAKKQIDDSGFRVQCIKPAWHLMVIIFVFNLLFAACSQSEKPDSKTDRQANANRKDKLYTADQADCSTFTLDDAAAILGTTTADIQVDSEELYAGNWMCIYKVKDTDKMVSLNLSLTKSVKKAADDMAQYRSHLETARGIEPFRKDLAQGAYSNIEGLGDDALWTAANGALSVRKGNISIQVQLPAGKDTQVEVAKKVLARL